jgi:hypothetical protein
MDKRYITLLTLAGIVRETPHPTQYLCTPREMILHSTFDWDLIHKHLLSLHEEGLVIMGQADTLQFSLTLPGMNKVISMDEPVADKLQLNIRQEIAAQ